MDHVSTASVSRDPLSPVALLEDFSLEMTGKDVPGLEEARDRIPAGTRINVTFLGNEDPGMRLAAAGAVRRFGFTPSRICRPAGCVPARSWRTSWPHCARTARRTTSSSSAATPPRPTAPTTTPSRSSGPGSSRSTAYGTSASAATRKGTRPSAGPALWSAIEDKTAALARHGLAGDVITQFGFAADPVLTWVEALRKRGIDTPVRIGVPGPAGIKRLMTYASRFGVGTSTSIARKYGFSITNLMGTAGPDRFIRALAEGYDTERHGTLKLHFYTFGGIGATSRWIADFRAGEVA